MQISEAAAAGKIVTVEERYAPSTLLTDEGTNDDDHTGDRYNDSL